METSLEPAQPKDRGGENPVVTNRESGIVHLKRRIVEVYDWVLGPAYTDKDRTDRMVAEIMDRKREYLDV